MRRSLRYLAAGIASAIFSSLAWVSEQEAVFRLSPLLVSSVAPLLAWFVLSCSDPLRAFELGDSIKRIRTRGRAFWSIIFVRNIFAFLVFTYALTLTSSAKVMFLTKVEPYVVLGIHWICHGERINRVELLLLAIHIFGAILLSTGADLSVSLEQWGDLLVLVGILASASVYKPAKELAEALGARQATALCSLVSGLILLPPALYFDGHKLGAPGPELMSAFNYLMLTVLLYYVFSTVFWFYSLQGVKAWLNSALRCLGPVVAAPIAWIFFKKTLDTAQICGAILVIGTSLLLIRETAVKERY